MEITELNFLENLSGNGNKTSAMDSTIGGHDDNYSYDFDGYFSHPVVDKIIDFDLGEIIMEVTQPEPEPKIESFHESSQSAAPGGTGVPRAPLF